ncbi:ATP-dependent DNA helicase hus2/rqh1 [Trametes pubescens]|uniref:DNA 3'-5' helicase n=1 Tax=Trametes pubescens TaxID=154538 RepID=A0A1M2W362_TRAPU|nr:ATP-dependent DNA helicase hus2/rqh1 [Trametes pubescens]
MATRPKNNLDEIQRKYALAPASMKPVPSTPRASGSKVRVLVASLPSSTHTWLQAKFKPAKSIATSTPSSNVTVRKLPSFSTPGFNKPKLPPLASAADNSLSVISISSTESTPYNASTSSIPVKRLSVGPPDVLIPRFSPKRAKTDHAPDKENFFRPDPSAKAKGKAREVPVTAIASPIPSFGHSSSHRPSPALSTTFSNSARSKTGAAELRSAFESLTHDADLEEKSEEDLRGVIASAQELIESCDKQVGAARIDAGEPRDVGFCNLLNDYLERRLASARAALKAIQRGERPAAGRATSVVNPAPPALSAPKYNDVPPSRPGNSVSQYASMPVAPAREPPKPYQEVTELDEAYWDSFDDDVPEEPEPPAVSTPATPPATQPRIPAPAPIVQERVLIPVPNFQPVASGPPPPANAPAIDPPELKAKPYYNQLKRALRDEFGLEFFRALQLKAICEVMDGRDVFVLFPTGSGKSLTFQLPAVVQDGLTVVVSPLRSLIIDQHRALHQRGIDVEYLLGDTPESQKHAVRQRCRNGNPPKLLYLTPEMLQMSDSMVSVLKQVYSQNKLRRFVIDEAHLITDWGRTFRDSYVHLSQIRVTYPGVPISALTATANAEVQGDIISRLQLNIREQLKLSFNRQNLDYEVRPKKKDPVGDMAAYIQEHHPRDTGIVYCTSRDRCEEVAKMLREKHNLNARHYHAHLAHEDKNRVQEKWSSGEVQIIVATIAFGMGIDKADVRFVIHFSLPGSLKAYYQETGRAGRDGKLAHCILYFSHNEYTGRVNRILKDKEIKDDNERRWQIDDLKHVVRYCTNDVRCRRQQVLAYFGEDFDPAHCRQLCNNCRNTAGILNEDHTDTAQKALRLFESLQRSGARLTRNQLALALRGSKGKDMVKKGVTNDPLYGACINLPQHVLERVVEEMCHAGMLASEVVQNGSGYSNTYLSLGPTANALLNGRKKLDIVFRVKAPGAPKAARKPRSKAANAQDASAGYDSPSAAGPSTSNSNGGGDWPPVWGKKRTYVPVSAALPEEAPPEKERSLYRDDPEPAEEDIEWFDDEIEDISSPPPPARRMGTRGVPAASQSMVAGYDSDIEEVDAPYRVTYIEPHDVADAVDPEDLSVRCREELVALRDELVAQERGEKIIEGLLCDETIDMLALMPPNDIESLRGVLDLVDVTIEDLKPHMPRILSICTKYHMLRK